MELKLSYRNGRRGISDLFGSLLMISITLVAGVAAFGWISQQAGTAEGAYGNSVANNVNFLNERFTVVSQTFGDFPAGSCSPEVGNSSIVHCTLASFWLYNNGRVPFNLSSIEIQSITPIPSGASNPKPLHIIFFTISPDAVWCGRSPQHCGFVAYDSSGGTACASQAATPPSVPPDGFFQNNPLTGVTPASLLPESYLSTNPYQVAMPTLVTCPINAVTGWGGAQYLYKGVTYTLTFNGMYGNSVSTAVTVSG